MSLPDPAAQAPFSMTPLPSKDDGRLACVSGAGFTAELRRYQCRSTYDSAFRSARPYIGLTVRAGTMRRRGGYLLETRRPEMMDLGRLFLIPAATPLQLQFEPGVREALACTFDPGKLAELDDFAWPEEALAATLDIRNPRARGALLRLVSELISPGPATQLVTEAAVILAAVELYRHFGGPRRGRSRVVGPLAPWQVRRVKERIEEAPVTALTVGDLAADCGISPRHLMRSFKAATGMTVGDYITEARINRAAALLTGSTLPIKQIAHRCGFRSTPAFSTAFKRVTGVTPRRRRQSNLRDEDVGD